MKREPCRIAGCTRPRQRSNGLCKKDYARWERAGKPDLSTWDGGTRERTVTACVICAGDLAGRPVNAVVCANPACARERTRRYNNNYNRPKTKSTKSGWPGVVERINARAGERTASLFLASLNEHRRRNGLPDVRP